MLCRYPFLDLILESLYKIGIRIIPGLMGASIGQPWIDGLSNIGNHSVNDYGRY